MRSFAIAVFPFALWVSSCSPVPEANTHTPISARETTEETARKELFALSEEISRNDQVYQTIGKPAASQPGFSPKISRTEIAGVSFEGVSFSSNSHRLVVVDQSGGPGSRFADSRSAAASLNGLAAANAGFFTPEGAPLGKVIASGKQAGSWNRASSLGAGVFSESASGSLSLSRRESASSSGQSQLLQAGPMLLENGRPVSGLDREKSAIRVFLLWDGGSRWWLGRSSLCTLAELGSALGKGSPAGWDARHALNLDGGRSADLWISGNVSGGSLNFRSLFNRPVRNFLVLVPR